MRVSEIIEEIEKYAEKIREVNYDNIQELFEYFEINLEKSTEEIIDDLKYYNIEATEFAIEMIKEYRIPLYSPIQYARIDETVSNLLRSRNEKEFMDNLEEYRSFMESWADGEIAAAEDIVESEIPSNLKLCAVRYQYWYGAQFLPGHSFVAKVYYTDRDISVEQFEEILEKEETEYDEILTKEELKEKLLDDYKYREKLGGGCWGTPVTEFEYIIIP